METRNMPPPDLLAWAQSHGFGRCLYKEVTVRPATEADGFSSTEMLDESGDVEMIPLEMGDGPSKQSFYIGKVDWCITENGVRREKAFFCWARR